MIMTHEEIIILAKEAGIIDPSPYIGARENQLLALERFALLVVADFLQRTGQYVTNDASREAAINAAHLAGQRAMRERAAVAAWSSGMDQHKKAVGMPLDLREVGSACASAIRALEVKP